MDSGILPVSLLFEKSLYIKYIIYNLYNNDKFPIDSGMLPVSLFPPKILYIKYIYSHCKVFTSPILNGMVPFRRLLLKNLQSDHNNTLHVMM
jgi:hypothetical protein